MSSTASWATARDRTRPSPRRGHPTTVASTRPPAASWSAISRRSAVGSAIRSVSSPIATRTTPSTRPLASGPTPTAMPQRELAMRASSEMKKLVVTMVAVACLPMVGCKKAGSGPSSLDEEGGARQQHSDPLVELELLEQEMNRLGLRTAADADTIAPRSAGEAAGADGEAGPGAEADALEGVAAADAAAAHRPPPPDR